MVDKEFDKMQAQGKMSWTQQPTPFGYPVFVVWRDILKGKETTRKGRVVVDIRGLNKITQTDAYPMPLQTEITAAVQGSKFISTVDGPSLRR